jgi:hypothetical protein
MLTKEFMVLDGYTSTLWIDEHDDWVQIESRTPWKSCFVLFSRKSHFSEKRIWGKCYKRGVKFMIRHTNGSAPRDNEYATDKEVFEDKLKGAL